VATSRKILSEKLLDDRVVRTAKNAGGIALKLLCLMFTGWPDRTVLLPGGRICFAEIKTTGKKLSPRQEIVISWLRTLGFTVFVVDDDNSYNEFVNWVNKNTT